MIHIKDFINRVQDGLASNANFKKTLQEAQKLKLNDRRKVLAESIDFSNGSELLEKYQKDWHELHDISEINAKRAEEIASVIQQIYEDTNSRFKASLELVAQLQTIPQISAKVDDCMKYLMDLQLSLSTVEDELTSLENIVEEHELAKQKMESCCQLNLYREHKLGLLQKERHEIEKQSLQRNSLREKRQQEERQRRQNESFEAFKEDIHRYRNTGLVPATDKKVVTVPLEQIDLNDEDGLLENFLNG